jgi:hypothetical protein
MESEMSSRGNSGAPKEGILRKGSERDRRSISKEVEKNSKEKF